MFRASPRDSGPIPEDLMRAFFVAVLLLPAIAFAQLPVTVGYQGRLVSTTGSPEIGVRTMQFAIYDDPTAGNQIWCETQSVALTDGYYAVYLGEGTACSPTSTTTLPSAFAGANRYLELTVAGSALTPRQRIATVPFAYVAGSIAGGGSSFIANQTASKKTGGYNIEGSAYVTGPAGFNGAGTVDTTQSTATVTGHGTAFGTEVVIGDLLTINTQSQHVIGITDATHLTVDGNWSANYNGYAYKVQKAIGQLSIHSTAATPPAPALIVNERGNVGISKIVPVATLDVAGSARFDKSARGAAAVYQLESVGFSTTNPFASQGVNTDWSGLMLDQGFKSGATYHLGFSINTDNQNSPTTTTSRISTWSDGGGPSANLELAAAGKVILSSPVGIGLSNPAASLGVAGYLHVSGSTSPSVPSQGAYLSWNATGGGGETDFINQRGGGAGGFNFYNATSAGVVGSAIATINSTGVYTASDERMKDISGSYHRGLSAIRGLDPIVFRWKGETGFDTSRDEVGFSAQNVRESIPEAVVAASDGHLTLTDRPIVGTLVNAVHELESQNAALKKQNDALEARLKALEEKVAHSSR